MLVPSSALASDAMLTEVRGLRAVAKATADRHTVEEPS
jgi:hypothetical protein